MIRTLMISALALSASAAARAACPPDGYDRAMLEALKAREFALPEQDRDAFALALADCLASPDPFLRDDIGFSALAHMLRADQLSAATRIALVARFQAQLKAPDREGVAQPFAALALSELARADRLAPFLDASARGALAADAVAYVAGVRDYRGFDAREGWRHGVAHGADLLVQFAVNPAVPRGDLDAILDAVGSQIGAHDGHFYIYGEGERLARVVLFAAQRGVLSEADWSAWFERYAGPGPLGTWDGAFASQAALARRHNLMAFLTALYANASLGGDAFAALLPGVEAALRAMP
ncbi:MAG: DUF2785 domain-containing protein [Alphaproteobacteria bacterium]|nr:DUF2785 domain-containing protein [Alphaproteobacteria bacterium]